MIGPRAPLAAGTPWPDVAGSGWPGSCRRRVAGAEPEVEAAEGRRAGTALMAGGAGAGADHGAGIRGRDGGGDDLAARRLRPGAGAGRVGGGRRQGVAALAERLAHPAAHHRGRHRRRSPAHRLPAPAARLASATCGPIRPCAMPCCRYPAVALNIVEQRVRGPGHRRRRRRLPIGAACVPALQHRRRRARRSFSSAPNRLRGVWQAPQ